MSSEKKSVQCHLRRGNLQMVSWVQKQFAIPGKLLRVKFDEGWSDPWEVTSVGDLELSDAYLRERSQDYKHTRGASDV